jgi:hypothetical protein
MKDRFFWILFAVVLVGLLFLLPAPFMDSVIGMFS